MVDKNIKHVVKQAIQDRVNTRMSDPAVLDAAIDKHATAAAEKLVAAEFKATEKEIGKATSKALRGGFFARNFRRAKIGGVVLAGAAILGVLASKMGKSRSPEAPAHDDVDDRLAALEASSAAPLAGPADGRAPTEWQARVRGGAAPLQPALNVADATDMGAVTTPPAR